MGLKVGDLVKHKIHDIGYGIVLTANAMYKGCCVCRVEWVLTNKRHLIDVNFLDKVELA